MADKMNNGLTDDYNYMYYKKFSDRGREPDYYDEEYENGYNALSDKVFQIE